VIDLEIKEMPLEEKYKRLYDQSIISDVITFAFIKEMGITDEYMDYSMKAFKKMLPVVMGSVFKFLKMIVPGTAFKKSIQYFIEAEQLGEPLSNIEVVDVSDREAIVKVKNSVTFKKYRDTVKKAGVDLDVREMWELNSKAYKEIAKDFGIDWTLQIDEDGWTHIVKLI
jgi:hypothetical protein